MTLVQWSRGASWRLDLPHSCGHHALIWVTKGQARATVDGVRRGVGVHNALAVPAGTLFSMDLGTQCFGLVCLIPAGGAFLMPDRPQHLRIREVKSQSELTSLLEALSREVNHPRDFSDEARNALAQQITIWLRRAMIDHEIPAAPTAAERLVTAYAAMVEQSHATGVPMADYARDLGVTPTHLTRSCKAVSGMTAADMLTGRVLHAARDMLEIGRDPIRFVAAQLGFSSAAYFSRFILHHTKKSPSELRRSAQSQSLARAH
ncbi:helix-turn-helix domain-containing protein [Roseovarius sp. LXJ103]|nr:helix-turn-helix domain-containing protein [Roseovarius carneus]PWE37172.1 AraC family transcriptional regulator [Pelagicola sp. LXJ1103]